MPASLYDHAVDPRKVLFDKVGDLSDSDLFHNQVLCAIYVAPAKTAGGIWRPDSNVDEDKYQGKVGLIIKMGPRAFKSDEKWQWPEDMAVGDWIWYRAADGSPAKVNGVDCRRFFDNDVAGRIPHPDYIW